MADGRSRTPGFFGFHCFVGVTREQTEAMLAFCFANVLLTAYEVFRFINKCLQADSFYGLDPLNYVRFFSVAVLSPVSLGLAIYVMRNFGWRDYKLVGADTELLSNATAHAPARASVRVRASRRPSASVGGPREAIDQACSRPSSGS